MFVGGDVKFLDIDSSDYEGGGGTQKQKYNSRSACHSSCLIVFVRLIGRFLGNADDE